jgi:hypothetical protein
VTSVVAGSLIVLTAEWRQYAGGPLTAVTGVTITITALPSTVVVGPTSTGVSTPATGINAYSWTPGIATSGSYLVSWSGTDPQSDTVSATEIVTVLPAIGSWAPTYVDDADLETFVRTTTGDDYIPSYAVAASRAVDAYCGRQFGQLAAAATFTYAGHRAVQLQSGRWLLEIDDVQDTTGMTVTVDGTAVDDFQLWHRNAAARGYPYTAITLATRPDVDVDVDVYARFGWNAVPAGVPAAVRLQVNRWHVRRESPFGTAGSPGEGSEIRLTAVLDPDVRAILSGGRRVRKRLPS